MRRPSGYNGGAQPPPMAPGMRPSPSAPAGPSSGYPQQFPGEMSSGYPQPPVGTETPGENNRLTVHEANRVKKAVDQNVKAIENRIRFFQREEEKIWKDLEEVRRQASMIEDGRSRIVEKKLADAAITQAKEVQTQANRQRAAATRQAVVEQRRQHQFIQTQAKQMAGQEQRRISQEILRQKRMQEAQTKLTNSEKAVAIQRTQLEARLRVNQERAEKLERVRAEQEAERLSAEKEVQAASARLPDLEAEEMMCLQRLQNSRIVTQSVLEELESSLGSKSSVTSLLRNKQRQQDQLPGVSESEGQENSENSREVLEEGCGKI